MSKNTSDNARQRSVESATCLKKKPAIDVDNSQLRLAGKHFVKKFPTVRGSKRKSPARKCSICNFTCQQLATRSLLGCMQSCSVLGIVLIYGGFLF